jgi:DNA-binding LacI/PurR family transcriptional regulator
MLALPESGDVVCADLVSGIPLAYHRMRAAGHRRIAAAMFLNQAGFQSEQMLAGAILALKRQVGDPRAFDAWIGPIARRDEAIAWLRRRRPQAVLGYYSAFADDLRRAGLGCAYASMITDARRPEIAGLRVPVAEIAAAAVDLMVQRLREDPGAPSLRRTHLVEMLWRDGASLAPAKRQ